MVVLTERPGHLASFAPHAQGVVLFAGCAHHLAAPTGPSARVNPRPVSRFPKRDLTPPQVPAKAASMPVSPAVPGGSTLSPTHPTTPSPRADGFRASTTR